MSGLRTSRTALWLLLGSGAAQAGVPPTAAAPAPSAAVLTMAWSFAVGGSVRLNVRAGRYVSPLADLAVFNFPMQEAGWGQWGPREKVGLDIHPGGRAPAGWYVGPRFALTELFYRSGLEGVYGAPSVVGGYRWIWPRGLVFQLGAGISTFVEGLGGPYRAQLEPYPVLELRLGASLGRAR